MIKWALKLLPLAKMLGKNKVMLYGGMAVITIIAGQQFAIAHKNGKIDDLKADIQTLELSVQSKDNAITELEQANNNWQKVVQRKNESHNACIVKLERYKLLEASYKDKRESNDRTIAELQKRLERYSEWSSTAIPSGLL